MPNATVRPTFRHQRDALTLIATLCDENPDLPAPYVTVMTYAGAGHPAANYLTLAVDFPDFEPWREVLDMPADAVVLRHGHESWLSTEGTVTRTIYNHTISIDVKLAGHGLPPISERKTGAGVVEYSDGLTEAFAAITPNGADQ